MSARARAARGRDDANQAPIVATYRALGCTVFDGSGIGFGFPDLIVGCIGVTELVEVKTVDGKLSPAQITFAADWRGSKVRIVRSDADAVAHVQDIRRRAAGRV